MLKAAERVTDEIALDQSDLADSLVRVGALGAGSARDHTTVSSLPALLSDYHIMKAELDTPQHTKD